MPLDSSRSITRYLEEAIPGVIGSGNPQTYRVTGGALVQTTSSIEDDEIRSDRGRGDSTLVSGSVGGSLNINLSHKTHNDFLEALLGGVFVPVGTNGVLTVDDMAFNATTHTISSATAALPVLESGQFFQISGANTAANNGIYKASSSTAPTTAAIVVDVLVKDVDTTDTAASTVISGARLKQGNADLRAFTVEREIVESDSISHFFTNAKAYPSSLNLAFSTGATVSGSIGFLGASQQETGTSSQFPGIATAVAATTTPSFNSVTGTSVLLDGAELGESCADSFTLDVNGNLRERRCIGSGLAASSIGADPFSISGSSSIFFGSAASLSLHNKHLADQPITFSVCVTDSEGNGFALTFPRAKITKADVSAGGVGSDVMMDLAFTAVTDPTAGTQLIIDALGSLA